MSELKAAIKNGTERGESLQEIGQSLTNAGYSKQEIDEAISELSGTMKVLPRPPVSTQNSAPVSQQSFTNVPMEIPNLESMPVSSEKKGFFSNRRNILIIIIVSVLILLGSFIGLVLTY